MSASIATATSETFDSQSVDSRTKAAAVLLSLLIVVTAFGFRAWNLGREGLSEDELNKLVAVQDYRAHGLTSANGEHPMLMKAMLTASIICADAWNETALAKANPALSISTEAALRFPAALVGALSALLILLLVTEMFGKEVAIIAACLWALDPNAIGFNRIAKEDSFFLFFFLLGSLFWLKGRRVAEDDTGRPEKYYWATAAAFGAMLASKYLPHFLAVSGSFYFIFQKIPSTKWRLGKSRWLTFFVVLGIAFLLCNPTILLPSTWHEMRVFAGEKRIGHDSTEFMGTLFRNQMTLWLKGVPWYFYYVFIGVKIPVPVIIGFLLGLPLLFRRATGDGRFFLLFWAMYWFMPFTVLGGKFTRYFTIGLPVVLITAALGIHFFGRLVARSVENLAPKRGPAMVLPTITATILIFPLIASATVSPYFRLYTNVVGERFAPIGTWFPHDEFYDSAVRGTVYEISRTVAGNIQVASETPGLAGYYFRQADRPEVVNVPLSDRAAIKELRIGDVVIDARGRRYFSNDAFMSRLRETATPVAEIKMGSVPAARFYLVDDNVLRLIASLY